MSSYLALGPTEKNLWTGKVQHPGDTCLGSIWSQHTPQKEATCLQACSNHSKVYSWEGSCLLPLESGAGGGFIHTPSLCVCTVTASLEDKRALLTVLGMSRSIHSSLPRGFSMWDNFAMNSSPLGRCQSTFPIVSGRCLSCMVGTKRGLVAPMNQIAHW